MIRRRPTWRPARRDPHPRIQLIDVLGFGAISVGLVGLIVLLVINVHRGLAAHPF